MQETLTSGLPQVKSVQFRLDYIHAERLMNLSAVSQPVNIMFNLNVLTANVTKQDTLLEVPFVANISSVPSIVTVTLKGAVILQFDNKEELENLAKSLGEGKVPELINMIIMQYVLFEASLVVRELGLPPIVPLPPPKPSEKTAEIHYV